MAIDSLMTSLSIPFRKDETGAIRIGGTRVLLELVIRAFEDGASPETIVRRYDTLDLADIYAVIAYYLKQRQVIDKYLADREKKASQIRAAIEFKQSEPWRNSPD